MITKIQQTLLHYREIEFRIASRRAEGFYNKIDNFLCLLLYRHPDGDGSSPPRQDPGAFVKAVVVKSEETVDELLGKEGKGESGTEAALLRPWMRYLFGIFVTLLICGGLVATWLVWHYGVFDMLESNMVRMSTETRARTTDVITKSFAEPYAVASVADATFQAGDLSTTDLHWLSAEKVDQYVVSMAKGFDITGVYVASIRGDFTGAFWWNNRLIIRARENNATYPTDNGTSPFTSYHPDGCYYQYEVNDTTSVRIPETGQIIRCTYEPRSRPWYLAASNGTDDTHGWTSIYNFVQPQTGSTVATSVGQSILGLTYYWPTYQPDGSTLAAVWGVDITLQSVYQKLATIGVPKNGVVYAMDLTGYMWASSVNTYYQVTSGAGTSTEVQSPVRASASSTPLVRDGANAIFGYTGGDLSRLVSYDRIDADDKTVLSSKSFPIVGGITLIAVSCFNTDEFTSTASSGDAGSIALVCCSFIFAMALVYTSYLSAKFGIAEASAAAAAQQEEEEKKVGKNPQQSLIKQQRPSTYINTDPSNKLAKLEALLWGKRKT
jgi:hypothetical protein